MGVLAMVMSGVNLYTYVEEHGMLLVLKSRVLDVKQWIRIRDQAWMVEPPKELPASPSLRLHIGSKRVSCTALRHLSSLDVHL